MLLPEEQGKGLSNPMLSIALRRLKKLGHKDAVLCTQSPRLPAISLYLKFGFKPQFKSKDDENAWKGIYVALESARKTRIGS